MSGTHKWWHAPGVPVFPVQIIPRPDGGYDKRPLTPNGHKDAKAFTDWDWKEWLGRGCNAVGIVMGEASGLYALDVDSYKSGADAGPEGWLDRWVPDWHETLQHATPSGGRHLIFRTNGAGAAPTRAGIVPGLDARGEGGWIAMGEGYAVVQDVPPRELPKTALEELRRGAAAHRGARTSYRKLSHGGFDAAGMVWRRKLIAAHPSLGVALDDIYLDRSAGLLNCAGEALRAGVDNVETFASLLWGSTGNAREHAIEKGWSRPVLRAWDKARGSGREDFDPLPGAVEDVLPGDGTGKRKTFTILDLADWTKDMPPPEYLVRGLLRRGYFYAATGVTGHGKTAWAIELAVTLARGEAFGPFPASTKGPLKVLYLAGENPDDIRYRFRAVQDERGMKPGDPISIKVIAGSFDLEGEASILKTELETWQPDLVIVDTQQAHQPKIADDNVNQDLLRWARAVRPLTLLPDRPTILVLSHPIKNASKTQLVPRGGSAFLNELDGNLTIWMEEGSSIVEVHFNKLRGVPFDPFYFRLDTVTTPNLKDSDGFLMPQVLARAVAAPAAAVTQAQVGTLRQAVLEDMVDNPGDGVREIAQRLQKSIGHISGNALKPLAADRLIKKTPRGGYVTTPAGERMVAKTRNTPQGAKGKPAQFDPLEEGPDDPEDIFR